MPVDPDLEEAIHEVTVALGQPERVARRLVAWLKELSERELSVQEQTEHLEALLKGIKLDARGEE